MAYRLIDPQADIRHAIDWTDFLEILGSPTDTIATSTWEITPIDEASPERPSLSNAAIIGTNSNVTIVQVLGCTRGRVYRLTNTIITTFGETDQRSITLRCEDR